MASFFRWLRRRGGQEAGVAVTPKAQPKPRWEVVESVASPALGSVYVQVLQQAGIPVLTREWGAGAGAMGGVATGMRVMVPENRLEEARAILDAGMRVADSEADDE